MINDIQRVSSDIHVTGDKKEVTVCKWLVNVFLASNICMGSHALGHPTGSAHILQ